MVHAKRLKKAGLFLRRLMGDPQGEVQNVYFRARPRAFYKTCVRKAQKNGLKGLYFLLSFDCDTERDFNVAIQVHDKLASFGITPIYAVPGELLKEGAEVYRELARRGAEFINHGYYKHSRFNSETGLYESLFFYEEISNQRIEEDMRLGHQAIVETLGAAPQGFRAPHFPTYQRQDQIAFIHKISTELGYRFSSSTVPRKVYDYGPYYFGKSGILEFPVTGCFSKPLSILDSWSFKYAPLSTHQAGDFKRELDSIREFFTENPDHVGIINLYADPSQVYDWPEYFEAVQPLAKWNVSSYAKLAKICGSQDKVSQHGAA